jgi:hypothetical protein
MVAFGQTHTMPGSNVVPSGASLTIQSGGTINAAAGSTVTGFGAGGGAPTTSTYVTQTPDAGLSAELALSTLSTGLLKSTTTTGALTTITDNSTNWNTAFTQMLQWDGGSTNLVAATGRTSLGGTTVGQSFFTLANPGAVTFPEISAGNVVSTKTAAQMQTDLGLVIGTNVQAFDTDLTTWAGITPVAAVGTWIATPSSANLRSAMTDENGTGALLFSGATTPDFTTGFTIGAAAASGKIPQGNGTNYVPSTPTWPTTAGTAGYTVRSDGTNYAAWPQDLFGSSVSTVSAGYSSETYLAGSAVTVAAGDWKVGGQYHCVFDMVKTGAGTATPLINVKMGTLGAVGDTTVATITFGVGTGIVDSGVFDVYVIFRTVGSGTSASIQVVAKLEHNTAITGLTTTGDASSGHAQLAATSTGFASTTQTKLGLSFSGGASFSGTNTLVQATLIQ